MGLGAGRLALMSHGTIPKAHDCRVRLKALARRQQLLRMEVKETVNGPPAKPAVTTAAAFFGFSYAAQEASPRHSSSQLTPHSGGRDIRTGVLVRSLSSVVECLSGVCKALGLIPSTVMKQNVSSLTHDWFFVSYNYQGCTSGLPLL